MKLIATINSFSQFENIKNKVDGIAITYQEVSFKIKPSFSIEEIKNLIIKANAQQLNVFIIMDLIVAEKDLVKMINFINFFKDENIYFIFSDYAIYQVLKENKITKKGIYAPDTLITNYLDFNFGKKLKLFGSFPAIEMPVSDIEVIGKNRAIKLFYRGFGAQVMFQSKAKLISNYLNYNNINDFDIEDIYLEEETRKEKFRIIETEKGTKIYASGVRNVLPVLDVLSTNVDYLLLDGNFLDEQKYIEVINIYQEALVDLDHLNLYNKKLVNIIPEISKLFIYEDTIYKKGDF